MLEATRAQSRAYGILQDLSDMLQSCPTPNEAARVAGEDARALMSSLSVMMHACGVEGKQPGHCSRDSDVRRGSCHTSGQPD